MPTGLPLDAPEMAIWTRDGHRLDGLVHHSDAGSQSPLSTPPSATPNASPTPTPSPSIGTVGDSYDSALAESTIGLCKTELVRRDGPDVGPETGDAPIPGPGRHLEALVTPQPPDTLVVHRPTVPAQLLGRTAPSPPRAPLRESPARGLASGLNDATEPVGLTG